MTRMQRTACFTCAAPSISTVSGRGLPLTLRTGTNCHRLSIARYFLRLTLDVMFTIHSDSHRTVETRENAAERMPQHGILDSMVDSKGRSVR